MNFGISVVDPLSNKNGSKDSILVKIHQFYTSTKCIDELLFHMSSLKMTIRLQFYKSFEIITKCLHSSEIIRILFKYESRSSYKKGKI